MDQKLQTELTKKELRRLSGHDDWAEVPGPSLAGSGISLWFLNLRNGEEWVSVCENNDWTTDTPQPFDLQRYRRPFLVSPPPPGPKLEDEWVALLRKCSSNSDGARDVDTLQDFLKCVHGFRPVAVWDLEPQRLYEDTSPNKDHLVSVTWGDSGNDIGGFVFSSKEVATAAIDFAVESSGDRQAQASVKSTYGQVAFEPRYLYLGAVIKRHKNSSTVRKCVLSADTQAEAEELIQHDNTMSEAGWYDTLVLERLHVGSIDPLTEVVAAYDWDAENKQWKRMSEDRLSDSDLELLCLRYALT